MAEALIGGAFLSALLQVLFDRMASHEVLKSFSRWKLNKEPLRKLKTSLLLINAVLNDAEEKQMKKPAVKELVDELKDATYYAQDLLDEISQEKLKDATYYAQDFLDEISLKSLKLDQSICTPLFSITLLLFPSILSPANKQTNKIRKETMVEAVVGGAFLPAFVLVLFERMASHEVLSPLEKKQWLTLWLEEHFSLLFSRFCLTGWLLMRYLSPSADGSLVKPLRKLKTSLLLINAVLNDAEEKQIKNPAVKDWVNELKNAAYQSQDLLDEIATVAPLYKLEAELKCKVLFNWSTSHSSSYKEIELKLEEIILGRLKFLAKQRDLLGLKEGGGEKPSPKRPTTSLVEESGVYGRNGDLLKQLIQLYLKVCKRLDNLPHELNLESLEILILSGCSKLKKFPEIGRDMTNLSGLYLDETAIEELPPSIKRLTGLTLQNLQDGKNLLTDDEGGKITEFSFLDMEFLNLLNLEDCKSLLTDDEGCKITELSSLDIQLQPLWQRFMEEQIEDFYSDFEIQLVPRLIDQSETNETETPLGISDLLVLDFDQCQVYNFCFPLSEIQEWFNHQSDEPLLTIPLPPNVYNDSTWMGLALCASVKVGANPDTILDIQNSETSYNLMSHLETSIECVESLHIHPNFEDCEFIRLSYIPRGSFQDSLNLCTRIEASVATDCPGLVQKCGLHLLCEDDEVEFKETIRQSMELFSNEHEVSPKKSSSTNEDPQSEPVDPAYQKDKGKGVLEY